MTEHLQLLGALEAIAAGDMNRESMIRTAKECIETQNQEALFEAAADAQTTFWGALSSLEEALGITIDGTRDLHDTSVEALLEEDEEEEGPGEHPAVVAGTCPNCRRNFDKKNVPNECDCGLRLTGKLCTDVRCTLRADHDGDCELERAE